MPKCRNCDRVLIEDATFCPECSCENPLEFENSKKKNSFNILSLFTTAFFWVWAVPLWVLLWLILGMFVFWMVVDSKMLDFQAPRSLDFQIPKFPDAGATACVGAAGEQTLRSKPAPSPNTARDQIRCKEPLLR